MRSSSSDALESVAASVSASSTVRPQVWPFRQIHMSMDPSENWEPAMLTSTGSGALVSTVHVPAPKYRIQYRWPRLPLKHSHSPVHAASGGSGMCGGPLTARNPRLSSPCVFEPRWDIVPLLSCHRDQPSQSSTRENPSRREI